MIESIIKVDTTKSDEEQKEVINKYKDTPGVWILVGRKDQSGAPWECLQVGQSKAIGKEIITDVSRLCAGSRSPTQKKYINQFGEFRFSYCEYPDRAECLYDDIAKHYVDLEFICVFQGEEPGGGILQECEKYVAYQTCCRYWVNGRSFSKAKDEQEIDSIKGCHKKECAELFKKIEKSIGTERANALKEFVEKLADGKIDA